ncbi:hypothetical protein PF005_g29617 [Phytophthora fragariae]|nr:hypothetical protein PF009_g30082 [Phytophthora fragariae]KAE9063568.1 hypothetical protein PF006_g30914 [Phytophthora fragariae]KAE9063855.1 hypothetical protein PF007_g29408 [Phytophthora fragariae]KAE9165414.1 hypothetical protein PF005_g29617 [Phytophthora fragariae]KAE9265824.1 hypothetical protein PF001_g30727 [Phytophthora fragariae]
MRSDHEGCEVSIRYFRVTIPPRDEFNGDEILYQAKLQQIREGLALLVAVKLVDQAAWRFMLVSYWDVDVGREGEQLFEEEIPARFELTLNLASDTSRRYALPK